MTIKTTIQQRWDGNIIKIQAQKVSGRTALELGFIVEGQAKLLAPKDTGYLAASITTQGFGGEGSEPDDPGKWGKITIDSSSGLLKDYGARDKYTKAELKITPPTDPNEVFVGTPLSYAPHQEFGTVRMNAQPYLRPALDLARGKVLTVCRKFGKMIFKDYLRDPLEVLK